MQCNNYFIGTPPSPYICRLSDAIQFLHKHLCYVYIQPVPQYARDRFLFGLKAMALFWYDLAEEQFLRAQEIEPSFGMAYWGEAMSHMQFLWSAKQADHACRILDKIEDHNAIVAAQNMFYITSAKVSPFQFPLTKGHDRCRAMPTTECGCGDLKRQAAIFIPIPSSNDRAQRSSVVFSCVQTAHTATCKGARALYVEPYVSVYMMDTTEQQQHRMGRESVNAYV